MTRLESSRKRLELPAKLLLLFLFSLSAVCCQAAASSKKLPRVAQWQRFEESFKSKVVYTNALQDVSLSVTFTSPVGEATNVDGFWDGDKIWRVRFAPHQPGRWRYQTVFSDLTNTNLHQQTGEFLCTDVVPNSRFNQHGPVRVAADHRHLEHADGTPFFWLADTVWLGPQRSGRRDWEGYVSARTLQKFTVAQWVAAPGVDLKQRAAFTGRQRIEVNPEFFQQLDERLDLLNQSGILSAIVPLQDNDPTGTNRIETLPEDQAIVLLRYQLARWSANDVVWLLACEGNVVGGNVARWKRIGRAVFGGRVHAPVLLFPGETDWVLNEFRDEAWVDIFGYQSAQKINDDALKWALAGPLMNEWRRSPTRPVINLSLPYEDELPTRSGEHTSSAFVRRALYWSLLKSPPAGISYGAYGVPDWNEATEPRTASANKRLPIWNKSLFLSGANDIATVSDFFNSIEFWRLRPAPELVQSQPGEKEPRRFIAAARTESKDVTVVYVPEERTFELSLDALPPSSSAIWINPRTGERVTVGVVVGEVSCKFATPNAGDWLLVIQVGKPNHE